MTSMFFKQESSAFFTVKSKNLRIPH